VLEIPASDNAEANGVNNRRFMGCRGVEKRAFAAEAYGFDVKNYSCACGMMRSDIIPKGSSHEREIVDYGSSALHAPWSSITQLVHYLRIFFTQKRAHN
jgi:hypothetical protein